MRELADKELLALIRIPQRDSVVSKRRRHSQLFRGELSLALALTDREEKVGVSLCSLGIYSQSQVLPRAGVLSFLGVGGKGILREARARGRFRIEMELEARFLSTELISAGFRRSGDVSLPKAEQKVSGQLSGLLRRGRKGFRFVNGSLSFGDREPLQGQVRRISVDLDDVRIAQARPAGSTPGYQRRIRVQPIQLGGPPVAHRISDQLARANSIWHKCCIKFIPRKKIVRPPILVNSTTDLYTIITAQLQSVPKDAIWMVFADHDTGGLGHCWSPGHAHAATLVERTETDINILAHELSHALGGDHPNSGTSLWKGERKSILDTGPNLSPCNPASHCSNAIVHSVLVETLNKVCRPSPDQICS